MDLNEKLRYYQSSKTERSNSKKKNDSNLADLLGGIPVDPSAAEVIKLDQFFEYSTFMDDIYTIYPEAVRLPMLSRNRISQALNLEDFLIFDLETTGLAGGAGTFPFLVGLGLFHAGGIQVIQYFLPDYGREIIAYLDLIKLHGSKKNLLSFNGKSYDYPLIRNRFILNRIDNPFENFLHLDLLHYARRIWKNQLHSCSLQTIEQEIFLFHRFGDIDGWMIPQTYFDFLRTGDLSEIKKIIHHNQQDILSLGRLLLHMHHLERDVSGRNVSDLELQTLFNLALQNSDLEKADIFLEQLGKRRISLSGSSLMKFSLLLKRLKLPERAIIIWEQLLASQKHILFALEQLAKYYEHVANDPQKAIIYTERGIKYLSVLDELEQDNRHFETRNSFEHRLNRLIRKIEKT